MERQKEEPIRGVQDVLAALGLSAGIAVSSYSQQLLDTRLELADRANRLNELLQREPQQPMTPVAELSSLSPDVAKAVVASWKHDSPWPAYDQRYADWKIEHDRWEAEVAALRREKDLLHERIEKISEQVDARGAKRQRLGEGTKQFVVRMKADMGNIPHLDSFLQSMRESVPLRTKLPISQECFEHLCRMNTSWRRALEGNVEFGAETSEEIEHYLDHFANAYDDVGTTALEVQPLQYALVHVLDIIGLQRRWNATSLGFKNAKGNPTRRDISGVTSKGISLFNGETKAGEGRLENLLEETREDLKRKITNALWDLLPGVDYLPVVATAGSSSQLLVEFGVIQKDNSEFRAICPLLDICDPDNRPRAALIMLKLLPSLKCLMDRLDTLFEHTLFSQEWKIVQNMSQRVHPVFYEAFNAATTKQWRFDSPDDLNIFQAHLTAVYDRLDTPEQVPWHKMWAPPNAQDPRQLLDAHGTLHHSLTALFQPLGEQFVEWTPQDVGRMALELLHALQLLRERNVVHNDIRLENVIVHRGRFLLIDFDDAAIMDEHGHVPGIMHLLRPNHAPTITEEHGPEVDVWGLGFAIVKAASKVPGGCVQLHEFGQWMMETYATSSLNEITQRLGHFIN